MITLSNAETRLSSSVVHGGDGFGETKLRAALLESGHEFVNGTGILREIVQVPVEAGEQVVDLTDTEAEFLSGDLFGQPYRGDLLKLQNVAFETLRDLVQRAPASGPPEMISFPTPIQCYLYPTPSEAFTLSLPWNQPFPDFDLATETPETVELPIPRRYVHPWLWWGARAYLLLGAKGHPDAGPAMQKFHEEIRNIKGRVHADGVWMNSPDASPGQVWAGGGYL